MTGKPKIKTYSTERFREKFLGPEEQLDNLLKRDFGKFFIVRVEDMIRLMKLPLPPSKATTHTMIHLTEGSAEMTIGGSFYKIKKNECLIVQAGQIFSIGNVDVDSGKGFLINFHNDMLIGKLGKQEVLKDFEFLTVWGNPKSRLGNAAASFVGQLLQRMFAVYSESGLENLKLIQSHFISLLCEIECVYTPLSNSKQTKSVALTNRFKELLFLHCKTHRLVSDYASLMNITPNHLNKVVREITDKSPTKWIDETLILEAKALLYQTDFPIHEIAEELGILDQSYFSRLFKKYAGVTPVQFRKMIETS